MKTRIIAVILLVTFASSLIVYSQGEQLLNSIYLTPFTVDSTVTRGAFVEKVIKALKLTDAGSEEAPYTDIADSQYKSAIEIAYSIGLIAPSETFNPDKIILTIDSYRIVLAATGWVPIIKTMGGTDADYMNLVRDLGLNINILSNDYAGISSQDANTLLYHMLTCGLAEQIVFGDRVQYQGRKEKNLIDLYYNIKKTEGIVTANEYTSLNSADCATKSGKIRIGMNEYWLDGQQDLLGKRVTAFYDDITLQILSITVEKTEVLNIASEDIENIIDRTITYYDADKSKRVTLADSFSCIKNGKKLDIYSKNLKALFTENQCDLTLIDADRDGIYETILMEVWQYCFVNVIDDENMVLYDKYDNKQNIDLSGKDVKVCFINEDISFDSIKKGMLLTFTCSDDGKLFRIKTDYTTLDGTISAINQEPDYLVVSDNQYTMTQYFKQNLAEVKVGKSGSFYLNTKGEIVLFVPSAEVYSYGWIINSGENSTLNPIVQTKIYTQEDCAQIYSFANRVRINGETACKMSLDLLNGNIQPSNRLVKYKINEKGEICDIYFSQQMNSLDQLNGQGAEFYKMADGSFRYTSISSSEGVMVPNTGNLSGGFKIDGSTRFFMIPATESMRNDEENLNVETSSNGWFTNGGAYNLTAFDIDENGTANVIMYLTDQMVGISSVSRSKLLYSNVVEDKMYIIDQDDNIRIKLFVCNGKEYNTIYSGDNNYYALDTVDIGDVIRYEADQNGIVKQFHLDFDFSAKSLNQLDANGVSYTLNNPFSGIGYKMGYLYDKSSSFMRIFEDVYQGDGVYRTDYTYENLTGYPVNPEYCVYVHVKVRPDGKISSLVTHRAGSGDIPNQYKLTGNGTADYALISMRSSSRCSNIFYDINVE